MSKLRCPECMIRVGSQDAVCPNCGYRFRMERLERILPFMRRPEKHWERRLSLLQRLYGILVIPAVTFWDIAHEPDQKGPLLIFLGNLFAISAIFLAMVLHIQEAVYYGLIYSFLGVLLVNSLTYLIWTIIYFGVIHLIIRLSGRDGTFAETFLIGQYASLPIFFANLLVLGLYFGLLPTVNLVNIMILYMSPIRFVAWALSSIAALWGAVLLALGIRERYRYPTSAALIMTFIVTIFVIIISFFAHITVIPII